MFLRDIQVSKIVGIVAKRDLTNKLATGSFMTFGCHEPSYDFALSHYNYLKLNTSSLLDYTTSDNPLAVRFSTSEYNKVKSNSYSYTYVDFDIHAPSRMKLEYF